MYMCMYVYMRASPEGKAIRRVPKKRSDTFIIDVDIDTDI